MRSRILILAQDVALRARLARGLVAAGYAVELAESAAHARRVERKDLSLAVVVPAGLERDADELMVELRAGTGGVLLVRDAADEASLPARVAEALKPPAAPEEAALVLHFAGFRLDVAGHSLTDPSGSEIPLSAGEFALLLALSQRPGRVLSRDRLLQLLAGRDAEAYDRSIDMQISRLRRKIEPDAKQPSLIVTVPGSGYKFAVEVRRADAGGAAAPAEAPPDDKPAPGAAPASPLSPGRARVGVRVRRRVLVAGGALGVALLVLAGWLLWPAGHAPVSAIPSIAVLPFNSLSGDPADARLADGITEDIITDLSRDRNFTVIARDSTEAYRGKAVDVRQIGKELNVSHVVEGTFRRDGDSIRVTAQLIDASTGTHLWSDRYEGPAAQIFAVQASVSDKIVASLGGPDGTVAGSVVMAAKRKRPADLTAYELYLLAIKKMHTGLNDAAQLEATRLLEQALLIDPNLARVHVFLAWNYAWRITYEPDTPTLIRKMEAEAQQAVLLDKLDADAHAALGWALALGGDLQLSEREWDEALKINPGSFHILTDYACFAHNFGKAKQGAQAADRAMRLNPSFPDWAIPCFRLGLVMVGRYEDVVKVQRRAAEDLWNTDGFAITAGSLAMLGRVEEAKALAARGVVQFPGLLSVEKFALNRQWAPQASATFADLMRKAGFPVCADAKDLAGIANPARLPECLKT